MLQDSIMSSAEKRAAFSLAAIFSTRMLGLFMILPVFALYAEELEGSTHVLVGLAIGIYGLTQAVLGIPFGMLSDKYGRKPVITFGLLVFALGSVVAAVSETMLGVIIGRALQGGGAIASVVMALAADLTREEHRIKAMATIGASIGLSFTVALVLGPVLGHWIGVPGIFWLTALMALVAIAILHLWVPQPAVSRVHHDAEAVAGDFEPVLHHAQLLRINYGVFALHLLLTATFVAVPLALRDAGLPTSQHWLVYLIVMLIALAVMVPFVIIAEKRRKMKQIFTGAIAVLVIAEILLMSVWHSMAGIVAGLLVFFIAFNLLEATLPSLVAKLCPADKKGTAMGVYSASQFLGAFCGGLLGGWLYGSAGIAWVFGMGAMLALSWLLIAASMSQPPYVSSHLLQIGEIDAADAEELALRLRQVAGVTEAVVAADEGVAYLKVDKARLDLHALREFSPAKS